MNIQLDCSNGRTELVENYYRGNTEIRLTFYWLELPFLAVGRCYYDL